MQGLWVVTCITTAIGALLVLIGFSSDSAPIQSAFFSGACALAIVPYVFTRAVQGLSEDKIELQLKRIGDMLDSKNEPQ